jgi:hypothetical protein
MSDNILWQFMSDHILWQFMSDHILWQFMSDHILWHFMTDHILWHFMTDHILWQFMTDQTFRKKIFMSASDTENDKVILLEKACNNAGHIYFTKNYISTWLDH